VGTITNNTKSYTFGNLSEIVVQTVVQQLINTSLSDNAVMNDTNCTIAIYGYCWTTLLIFAISMSRLFCHTSMIGPVEVVEVGILLYTVIKQKGHHWQNSTYKSRHNTYIKSATFDK